MCPHLRIDCLYQYLYQLKYGNCHLFCDFEQSTHLKSNFFISEIGNTPTFDIIKCNSVYKVPGTFIAGA